MSAARAPASRVLSDLFDLPLWCAWRHEDGRKPPVSVRTRRKCDTADRTNLGTLKQADAVGKKIGGGVGLVLGPLPDDSGLSLGMVDLDGSGPPGQLAAWAQAIVDRLATYAETSPSGQGAKSFFLYRIADLLELQKIIGKGKLSISWKRGEHEGIEVYLGSRYGTVTGQAIDGNSVHIGEPELRVLDIVTLRWLIQVAGPEYKAGSPQGGATNRDESGSAAVWRFLLDRFRAGDDAEAALAALEADDGTAGTWMTTKATDRDRERTTSRAREHVERQKAGSLALLDDEPVAKAGTEVAAPSIAAVEAHGDLWLGRVLAHRHRGKMTYVATSEQWLRWGVSAWALMTAPELDAVCKAVAERALAMAMQARRTDSSDEARRNFMKAARTVDSIERCRRIADSASSEPGMFVAGPDAFDGDAWMLGVRNGAVNLRTGELRPADPAQMISRLSAASYDPDATCPRWDRFLEQAQPDPEMRRFLQMAVGYTLTGVVDEEVMFLCYGSGQNGKSVFLNVVYALLGEYAATCSTALLAKVTNESDAERQIAQLPGRRLISVNEIRQGAVWDDARLKMLVSRERIPARLLHREAFSFLPTHKIWARANNLPGSLDSSEGMWRRLLPILWPREFPPDERTPDLDKLIVAGELPGVLAWAVRGAMAYANAGRLKLPASVETFRAEYRQDTDTIGRFIADTFVADPSGTVTSAEAWQRWRWFCEEKEENIKLGSRTAFGRVLTARGFKRHTDPASRQYVGVRLRVPDRQHPTEIDNTDGAPGGASSPDGTELADDCAALI